LLSAFTVDGTTMPSLRDAAVGSVSGAMWDVALKTPGNADFIAAFRKKYDRIPSLYAAVGYDTARLLDIAVRKVNGNTENKAAFASAVKASGSELKSVRGPFSFNTNNMPIQNYYAFQTIKDGNNVTVKQLSTPLTEHRDIYATQCKGK
jgi:branched-chain amino acid transport system substrate-binding protein